MINNIGFKGTYLIIPPADMGESKEDNKKNLQSALNFVFIEELKEAPLPLSKIKETRGGIWLKTPEKTDFSYEDKRALEKALFTYFASFIMLDSRTNDAKRLYMRFKKYIDDQEEKSTLSSPSVINFPSVINLNRPVDGEPLPGTDNFADKQMVLD